MWCERITVSIIVVPVTRRHRDKWQINSNSGVVWRYKAGLFSWMPLDEFFSLRFIDQFHLFFSKLHCCLYLAGCLAGAGLRSCFFQKLLWSVNVHSSFWKSFFGVLAAVIVVIVQPYLVFYRCVSVVEQLKGRHIPSPIMAELGEVRTGHFFHCYYYFFGCCWFSYLCQEEEWALVLTKCLFFF